MSRPGIKRSAGVTPTERALAALCDRTFMKVWTYANPRKDDRKELCDIIAVFDDHIFLFFDRESLRLDVTDPRFLVQWERWKRKVVDDQIRTAKRAEVYIRGGGEVYVDTACTERLPVPIRSEMQIHKIIVARGAEEACRRYSDKNVSGSLAISYSTADKDENLPPFFLELNSRDMVHVLDTENVDLILTEIDTMPDFAEYLDEKEAAIARLSLVCYCAEEDLLCAYLKGYDEEERRYRIAPAGLAVSGIIIEEGCWHEFRRSAPYKRRSEANKVSYLWDRLMDRTCDNAITGSLEGDADLAGGPSAIREMAREPRVIRRANSFGMIRSIKNFPDNPEAICRSVSLMPSFSDEKAYVFLQLYVRDGGDYDSEYRPKRRRILEVACAAAKERFPHLKTVVGIAIDAPKHHRKNSEDFILMDCSEWDENAVNEYKEDNEVWNFFRRDTMKETRFRVADFPPSEGVTPAPPAPHPAA